MEIDELAEIAYRSKMRALARRGGAATKLRLFKNPDFYHEIGPRGGLASARLARARIAASLVSDIDRAVAPESATGDARATMNERRARALASADAPLVSAPPPQKRMSALDAILADFERPGK